MITDSGVDANALYPTLNAPSSLGFALLNVTEGAHPDDLENQVAFDYNGQIVTALYFLFGAQGNATNNAQRSGVSGLAVIAPEPSSTVLLALSALAMTSRRRR